MADGAVEAAPTFPAERPPSGAARLARAARAAALDVDGVTETTAGRFGRHITTDRDDPVRGVVAIALGGDAYELALHLVAEPVPLHALADRVRERVRTAAAQELSQAKIGSINVTFEDLVGDRFPDAPDSSRSARRRRRRSGVPGEAAQR